MRELGMIWTQGIDGTIGSVRWALPEAIDLLDEVTRGAPVIMGRATWESLVRPLPGRQNIVLTSDKNYQADGAVVANTIADAEFFSLLYSENKAWVMGGAETLKLFMPKATELVVTTVNSSDESGSRAPEIDSRFGASFSEGWQQSANGKQYSHQRWEIVSGRRLVEV